jgi:hypothetical protein
MTGWLIALLAVALLYGGFVLIVRAFWDIEE